MGEVISMFTRRELEPEEQRRQDLIAELAVIDQETEPMLRRAEVIRRELGLLAIERGLEG